MTINSIAPGLEGAVRHQATSENPIPPSTWAALGCIVVSMAAAPVAILALPAELSVFAGFTIAAGIFAAIGYIATQV